MSENFENLRTPHDYFSSWKDCVDCGELKKANIVANQYLAVLLKKRCIKKALDFIQKIKKIRGLNRTTKNYELKFLILIGDEEAMNKNFPNLVWEYMAKKDDEYKRYNTLVNSTHLRNVHWIKSAVNYKFEFLKTLREKNENPPNTQLIFIKKILSVFALYPDDQEFMLILLEYCIKNRRKILGQKTLKTYIPLGNDDIDKEHYEKLFENMDVDEEEMIFDLGKDLLRKTSQQEKVRILLKDIEAAKLIGDLEEEKKLKNQLEELDANNTVFFDLQENVATDNEAIKIADKVESENERSCLIDKVTKKINEKSKELLKNEQYFIALIKSFKKDDLYNNYSDLVIIFNQIAAYKVSLHIFNRLEVLIDENDYNSRLKFSYLKIETQILAKKYYNALNELDIVFSEIPLLPEEKKCYYYLKAEVLRHVLKYNSAMKYYQKVAAIDKSYRLVKVRIKEIEEI